MKCIFWFLFYVGIVVAAPPAWIDLPNDDLEVLARFEDDHFVELNCRSKLYHRLEKSNGAMLSERIVQLGLIVEYLDEWLQQETISYKLAFLKNLRAIAVNKRWYLHQLQNMNSSLPILEESLRWNALPLVNRRYYDFNTGMYWGEYLLEVLDPCHRQLTTYHDRWIELKKGNSEIPSFFFWLEEENLPRDISYVVYLDYEEKLKLNTHLNDGLLCYYQTGEVLNCFIKEKEYIFIIDLGKNLYIVEGSKQIRHTSLSHGMPVLGAGNIRIKNGIVQSIGFASGHYLPEISNGVQILNILFEKGIPFAGDAEVSYFQELEMHTIPLILFKTRFCNESH